MSTSKSVDGATGYEQGAGRVDVARATRQTLTATGSVGYGFFKYGVDHDPVTRTVEYRNDGDTAQVLDLSVRGDNGLGAPLPMRHGSRLHRHRDGSRARQRRGAVDGFPRDRPAWPDQRCAHRDRA